MDTRKSKSETSTGSDLASAQKEPLGRASGAGSTKARARIDQQLVKECLAGDERAWERLYRQCHPRLMEAVKFLLGRDAADVHLVEEIAARVWYALLRDRARLLARYDAERDARLEAFLMGLARIEIMRHMRSERRRRTKEFIGGRKMLAEGRVPDWQVTAMIDEFASTLTPQEQEFMEEFLLDLPPTQSDEEVTGLSVSNVWQRRHRIRLKLRAFLNDD